MPTLADLVASYTRTPSATCYLDGRLWRGAKKFSFHQKFKEQIETGSVEGRNPPVTPQSKMEIRWTWGYDGVEVGGFKGYVTDTNVASYPNTDSIQCAGELWLADQNSEVMQTSPLNGVTASAAAEYLLTTYGAIPSSRLNLPSLPASGAAWVGSEWTLGILTPVQWGDPDTQSGGTSAMKAAAEIYGALGYWLYSRYGVVTAKQMERRPSSVAREVFERDVNLLIRGAPERKQSYADVFNRVTARGANTGVDGAQLYDQWRTTHPLSGGNVNKDFSYSSFLLEYENATDAGAASITEVAKRILKIVSRIPDVVPLRAKADPNRSVGDTVGIIDTGIRLTTQKNYFIYQIDRTLDLDTGAFDDQLLLDGGVGNSGFTTVPPPDASFVWEMDAETLDATAVVVVTVDGSGSTSPTGEIVSWAWSTSTTTYGGTPNSATGVKATFFFALADSPATIALTVTDTTSKTADFTATIDLTGADTRPPLEEAVSAAAGAAWYVTPDGGATWNIETTNGDAIAVGTIGAGADDRAGSTTAGAYGVLATRGSGGTGLRQSLDLLATASTNLVAAGGAITSNIWVNEANPARVWFAVGTAVYRSTDGGATKTAMHVAPATVHWIMEDPAVDNSVFLLAGANMYNATDPAVGWALLYAGPVGATARQFVRSRDGQVTWVAFTGAASGESLQRVETGALADWTATDCQSLALDRTATSIRATLYGVTADDPAQIWSFDGLTGLSAVQSAQTFPAGATVQHILGSRLFDVIYCADFDSVAVGTGAFRKYFPIADELLLWKELAAGQQAHMLGLAARAAAPAEFLRMTIGVDPGGVWHYRDGAPTFHALPVSGTVRGIAIAADPFNCDRWLAVFNNSSRSCYDSSGVIHGDGWAHSPLWYTEDAGVTWTEVVVTTPGGWVDGSIIDQVRWNDLTGNSWGALFGSPFGGSPYTAFVRGTAATVTSTTETTDYSATGITGGVDGEWVLVATVSAVSDKVSYFDSSLHTASGSSPGDISFDAIDRLPALSTTVFIAAGGVVFATTDYRSAQPTTLSLGTNVEAVAVSGAALYYLESDGDLWRVADPLGAATATQLQTATAHTNDPKVDRQTRTTMAFALSDSILVDDGTTTTAIAWPSGGLLSDEEAGGRSAFEVMVRS